MKKIIDINVKLGLAKDELSDKMKLFIQALEKIANKNEIDDL